MHSLHLKVVLRRMDNFLSITRFPSHEVCSRQCRHPAKVSSNPPRPSPRIHGFRYRSSLLTSSNTPAVPDSGIFAPRRKTQQFRQIRTTLACIAAINAILSVVALGLGYWTLHSESLEREMLPLRIALGCVSLVQTALVILSWSIWLQLQEVTRVRLGLAQLPVPRLAKSLPHLLVCGLECAFHLLSIFPWPQTSSLYKDSASSLLLLALFIRNYHLVQWVYWSCDYSSLRYCFFAHLQRCASLEQLAGKVCLRQHGFLVLAVLVVIPILAASLLISREEEGKLWVEVEAAVYTLARIRGNSALLLYGFVLQCICMVVLLLYMQLTRREDCLCFDILQKASRSRCLSKAAALIQCWWRMKLRCPWRKSSPSLLSHINAFHTSRTPSSCSSSLYQHFEGKIHAKVLTQITQIRTITTRIQHQLRHLINEQRRICLNCFHIANAAESAGSERISPISLRRNSQRLDTIAEENSENATSSAVSPVRELRSGESEDHAERLGFPSFSLHRVESL